MDSAEFHAAVYEMVRKIPFGRVTSYGHIARLVGMPRHSRHVGQALKFLNADSDVPWQRVVSSAGKISSRGPGTDGAQRQREALEEEGVEVRVTPGGEFAVDFVRVGWFPDAIDLQQHPINLDELQPIEDGPAEDHRDGTGAVNGDGGSIAVPGGDDLV